MNEDTYLVMIAILVAVATAMVLLLNRTHSRTDEAGGTAVDHEADADFRRLREDLRSAAGRVIRSADRVLSLPARTLTDRARSELMEPPERGRAA